jgi:hypothetical protein
MTKFNKKEIKLRRAFSSGNFGRMGEEKKEEKSMNDSYYSQETEPVSINDSRFLILGNKGKRRMSFPFNKTTKQ